MNALLHVIEVLLVDQQDEGEVGGDPRDVDQGEDNPGKKKMKEIRKHGFQF